ncbi:hypothetical protein A9995_09045 [Erythrobacter sp. QSSC1-22B]|uniref:hypothetical protein n=1 Tax=Erythrobacter sp. QSSC1-22B TaxID=1860125 RepID=UPI0008058CB5|nr:hypothetical protein [Erythrobacter sp. QSSC1-22B]OBX19253.1 hypothetical protein A9995_09045 [Erythrobacter sp. QSSC1-22B]
MIILMRPQAIANAIQHCSTIVPVQTLQRYREMLQTEPIAWLYILQPGDTACCLEAIRRRPFESWEFIDRDDGWYSATFVISDDGFGHVVLIPDQPDTDPELLAICKTHST